MAQDAHRHEIECEQQSLPAKIKFASRAQLLGGAVILAGLSVTALAIWKGTSWVVPVSIVTTLGGASLPAIIQTIRTLRTKPETEDEPDED